MFLVGITNEPDLPFDTVEDMVTASRSWALGWYTVWLKDEHVVRGVNASVCGEKVPVAAGLRRYELKAGNLDVQASETVWHPRSSMNGYVPSPYYVYSGPPHLFGAYEPERVGPGVYELRGHGSFGTVNFIVKRAVKDGFSEVSLDTFPGCRYVRTFRGKKGSEMTVSVTDDGRVGGPEWSIGVTVPVQSSVNR